MGIINKIKPYIVCVHSLPLQLLPSPPPPRSTHSSLRTTTSASSARPLLTTPRTERLRRWMRSTSNSQLFLTESTSTTHSVRKSSTTTTQRDPAARWNSAKTSTSSNSLRKSSHSTSPFTSSTSTTLVPTGLLVSTRNSKVPPSRKSSPLWELLSTKTGPLLFQRRASTLLLTSLLQIASMPEHNGQSASPLSTTFVTNPTADHAGLTELPRLLTTVLASLPMELLPNFTPLLIPLPAATSFHASQWDAMVDRLEAHGTGSRRRVLYLEETSVITNFASTTAWRSAPTTSSPQL